MNMRKHLLETVTIVGVSILLALLSNAFANRERALSLTQTYAAPTRAGEPPKEAMIIEESGTEPEATTREETPDEPGSPSTTTAIPESARDLGTPDILERFPPTEDLPAVEIDGDDAEFLHTRGALFLDARRTSDYRAGHIEGARSFPVWESDIDERVAAMAEQNFDTNAPIVIYCSGGECQDSHMLAQKLWGMFFNNILIYKEGFPDWQQRGGPTSTGAQP